LTCPYLFPFFANVALDDFLWEIYARPAGIFEQDPPSDAVVEGALEIVGQAANPKALSRFVAYFPRRAWIHEIENYDS
jgi:hypothetical protein